MTGFESKRDAAADKLLEEATRSCNNIDEQRALDALMREAQPAQEPVCDKDPQGCWNVRCQLGKQCKNLAQPPSEWAGIKAILDEYGLQAIDFVADFKAALAQPAQEPVGKVVEAVEGAFRCEFTVPLPAGTKLYTTPPKREWVGLTDGEAGECHSPNYVQTVARIEAKLKEKNT